MKLAFIPPAQIARTFDYTGYQLMLPQEMRDPNYKKVYAGFCKDPEQFVILDNGAAEGYVADWEALVGMANNYRPNELVIPDVIGDMAASAEQAMRFIELADEKLVSHIQLAFVAQGQSLAEFVASGVFAQEHPEIQTIMIPRHAIKTLSDPLARWKIVQELIIKFGDALKPIHFLGMNIGNRWEFNVTRGIAWERVRGVDTSMPFILSWHGVDITDPNLVPDEKTKRPDHYFQRTIDEFPAHPTTKLAGDFIWDNCSILSGWVLD